MKNKEERKLIGILIFLVLILALIISIKETITSNTLKKQKILEKWLLENCKCVERERPKCYKGFELEKNVCINKTLEVFTSIIYSCSKYNCSNKIYSFNMKKEKWEKAK